MTGNGGGTPAGRLVVKAELLNSGGGVKQTLSIEKVVQGITITPSPALLTAPAGGTFPTLSATLSDGRGLVTGVPVTFTISPAGPTFPPVPPSTVGAQTDTETTVAGVATAPPIKAPTTAGEFTVTISADGAVNTAVPLAAQYGLAAFVSPVSATTTTSATGTTPVKIAALLANGSKISDAQAALLVQQGRLQIRYRQILPTQASLWSLSPAPITYDAQKDFFQSDLKASALKWAKGNTYRVEFRILAPSSTLQSSFDLGSRSFDIKVTK